MANLSRRQRDVLLLMARGLNNKEIARELGLAIGTVRSHVCQLFERIDVHSRLQAVVWYLQQEAKHG